MLQKLQQIRENKKSGDGFTIIEVMIVLAIAGLILVVVLVAIPQLQRNQRNSARQATIARISTEIGNYSGNNNGRIPTSAAEINSFQQRYLSGVDTVDPSTGSPMVFISVAPSAALPTDDGVAVTTVEAGADGIDGNEDDVATKTGGGDLGVVYYATGAECNGENVAAVAGAGRTYVVYAIQEGGSIYCLDNK